MPAPRTEDLRVRDYLPLMPPGELKQKLPLSQRAQTTVIKGRETIQRIIDKEDSRILAIVGPCSIHDEDAALAYAEGLMRLKEKVKETIYLVMRVYFEKPRTTVGWKGLISDPELDGSCDMNAGLFKARNLIMKIAAMGLPTATEMLDPITPQYLADAVCWSAIGARTTESQTHREMASGLSMPVGFKNGTDGNLTTAINALVAARASQTFLGIDQHGRTCVVKTGGNPYGHIVLRGGSRPNYDPISIEEARLMLITKKLPEAIIVDCSHANSHKKYQGQAIVWRNVIDQIANGSESVIGLMLESNLHEGNQKYTGERAALQYGISITDECIAWETTEELLVSAHAKLASTITAEGRRAS